MASVQAHEPRGLTHAASWLRYWFCKTRISRFSNHVTRAAGGSGVLLCCSRRVTAGDPDAPAVLSKVEQEPRGTVSLLCSAATFNSRDLKGRRAAAGSHPLSFACPPCAALPRPRAWHRSHTLCCRVTILETSTGHVPTGTSHQTWPIKWQRWKYSSWRSFCPGHGSSRNE